MAARSPYKMSLYGKQERQKAKFILEENGFTVEACMKVRDAVLLGRRNKVRGIDAANAEKCSAHLDLVRYSREIFIQDLKCFRPYKEGHVEGIQNWHLKREYYVACIDFFQDGRLPRFESKRGKEAEKFVSVNRHYRHDNTVWNEGETLFSGIGWPESRPEWRRPPRYSILIARDGTIAIALILIRNGELAEMLACHIVCGPVRDNVPTIEAKISYDSEYDGTAQPAEFDVPIKPHDGT